MESLNGKVVLVTGAASGMGAGIVSLIQDAGGYTIATDIGFSNEEESDSGVHLHLDVASEEDWQNVASWTEHRFGQIDGLVNNAGVSSRASLLEVALEEWNRTFDINVTGTMLGIQTISPLLVDSGSVINISSFAGLTALRTAAYTASKWAVRGLSRVAVLELGERGIRVNTLFPGSVDTPLTRSSSPAFISAMIKEIPLGRQGTIDDLSPMVCFLLSDQASWITGAEISIDGGAWSHGGTKSLRDASFAIDD